MAEVSTPDYERDYVTLSDLNFCDTATLIKEKLVSYPLVPFESHYNEIIFCAPVDHSCVIDVSPSTNTELLVTPFPKSAEYDNHNISSDDEEFPTHTALVFYPPTITPSFEHRLNCFVMTDVIPQSFIPVHSESANPRFPSLSGQVSRNNLLQSIITGTSLKMVTMPGTTPRNNLLQSIVTGTSLKPIAATIITDTTPRSRLLQSIIGGTSLKTTRPSDGCLKRPDPVMAV